MEISDVRRQVLHAIDRARRESSERRTRADAAQAQYAEFLANVATPLLRMVASALTAAGHPFKVFSPADSVRLMSDRAAQDFLELSLDGSADPPVVMGRVSRGRGSRVIDTERPVHQTKGIGELREEDVLEFVLREIGPFVER